MADHYRRYHDEIRDCRHSRRWTLEDYDLCLYCEVGRLKQENDTLTKQAKREAIAVSKADVILHAENKRLKSYLKGAIELLKDVQVSLEQRSNTHATTQERDPSGSGSPSV
jgi:hypothetical protein